MLESPFIWYTAGLVLMILEIFVPGFVLACFGLGALAAGIAAHLGAETIGQVTVFSVSTLVVTIVLRPIALRYLEKDAPRTNADALAGRPGVVLERIDDHAGTGRVKVGGEDWRSRTGTEATIEANAVVRVLRVEGATVYVEAVTMPSSDTETESPGINPTEAGSPT